ncbi:MAG: hypothetical protein OSA98_08780 [Rubripirellula sp.]|nr:hypothetical protein [Rubripirellula sp.]
MQLRPLPLQPLHQWSLTQMFPKPLQPVYLTLLIACVFASTAWCAENEPVRVFIFAGQSNMVGSDSKVKDISRFPPFIGLEQPQPAVQFSYSIGRENKFNSDGWVPLQPVNNVVGPELSFARRVANKTNAPIAIIKCAAGGTHLGGDWNPDEPQGFKMYPATLSLIQASLQQLKDAGLNYRIEGFMWHQGENDMFNEEYMASYGQNLKNFISKWRRDLNTPDLKFYIGELCTKTIWGMDLRPRMYAISLGQKSVTKVDPLAEYIPTSHVGVEIGSGVGLHYHYGTLGQLEHGINYADAYLRTIGKSDPEIRSLKSWPYDTNRKLNLYVLAGHRNMEGERAFIQDLGTTHPNLLKSDGTVAYKYNIGGGQLVSHDWEPLGPAGYYDTFGPEVSFSQTMKDLGMKDFAIAKFTHSGSQMNDWTPEGSMAKSRHLYPRFIRFVKDSIKELKAKGHNVELAGILYHVGENDMSMPPYRRDAPAWLKATIEQSRLDLEDPTLNWYVSQQPPTKNERVDSIDVASEMAKVCDADPHTHLNFIDSFPEQEKQLVLDTAGIVWLGQQMAGSVQRNP